MRYTKSDSRLCLTQIFDMLNIEHKLKDEKRKNHRTALRSSASGGMHRYSGRAKDHLERKCNEESGGDELDMCGHYAYK